MDVNSNVLIDGLGYVTVRELIPNHLIDNINLKLFIMRKNE